MQWCITSRTFSPSDVSHLKFLGAIYCISLNFIFFPLFSLSFLIFFLVSSSIFSPLSTSYQDSNFWVWCIAPKIFWCDTSHHKIVFHDSQNIFPLWCVTPILFWCNTPHHTKFIFFQWAFNASLSFIQLSFSPLVCYIALKQILNCVTQKNSSKIF